MKAVRHVYSPLAGGEHAFCGLAFDAYESGDHDHSDEFCEPREGLSVTCPECCAAIRALRQAMKGLRMGPRQEEEGR